MYGDLFFIFNLKETDPVLIKIITITNNDEALTSVVCNMLYMYVI